VLVYSIVMAPKKAVVASRRSIRAIVRKPKASSDSQSVDMLSASAEVVVRSADESMNKGSLVRTESTELGVVRRSKTIKKRIEHTVASEKVGGRWGKVGGRGQITVITSEGRENATQRSDIEGGELPG